MSKEKKDENFPYHYYSFGLSIYTWDKLKAFKGGLERIIKLLSHTVEPEDKGTGLPEVLSGLQSILNQINNPYSEAYKEVTKKILKYETNPLSDEEFPDVQKLMKEARTGYDSESYAWERFVDSRVELWDTNFRREAIEYVKNRTVLNYPSGLVVKISQEEAQAIEQIKRMIQEAEQRDVMIARERQRTIDKVLSIRREEAIPELEKLANNWGFALVKKEKDGMP
jgi:hypothetical protein